MDVLIAAGVHECVNFDAPGGSRETLGDDIDEDGEKHARRDATPLRDLGDPEARRGEELLRRLYS